MTLPHAFPATPSPSTPASGLLAAIDMGSNSFRLEIAQLQGGRYKRMDYLKETVRLGAGLDDRGMLTEEAMLRGLNCLSRFAKQLEGFEGRHIRAVATQTLREAQNRDDFLARAQSTLGHAIEVISGREEARLIFAGVARLQPSERARLVIDIGGRSTEMILGQGRRAMRAESFQVGSVSLSMRFFENGRCSQAAFAAAQVAAEAELEEALEPFAATHWEEALGSSGTVGAVSQVLSANGISDGSITPAGLRWLVDRCVEAGQLEALRLPGLKEDRRAVIAGGVAILSALASNFGIEVLRPTRGALRQGVIFDLSERLQATEPSPAALTADPREATVAELQQRFQVDIQQAQRVQAVAQALFARVQPQASVEARLELSWAAALHEMGMMVAHHDHHRHSAYVMAHVDAAGFSQSQQRRLGDLLLAQRGGLRKVAGALTQAGFAWQVMCLRLAVIKCHARTAVSEQAIKIQALESSSGQGVAQLKFSKAWASDHPRTLYLLQEEMQAWGRVESLQLSLHQN